MDNFYSIRIVRVSTPWFKTQSFYIPMKHNQITGIPQAMQDTEMPTIWGYETEDGAWAVIDAAIWHDEMLANDNDWSHVGRDSSREDFHADG
jgi:hypothetical protein